jgi:hypothetical protein
MPAVHSTVTTLRTHRRHPRSLWFLADVIRLFPNNVDPFSSNVVLGGALFSINLVPKQRMFLGQAIYVLRSLQLGSEAENRLFCQ